MATGLERRRELRRRRQRKKKIRLLKERLDNKPSETELIKDKVRKLTPGAQQVFKNWGLTE